MPRKPKEAKPVEEMTAAELVKLKMDEEYKRYAGKPSATFQKVLIEMIDEYRLAVLQELN